MRTRVERFKNYRHDILMSDDGDLPIAKSKGKYLKKEDNLINSQLSYKGKNEENIKKMDKGRIFIIVLASLIIFLILLGIILSL